MDLKKLTPGEMVIAVSGVVLLIFSFFKWYSIEFSILGQTVGASRNGWPCRCSGKCRSISRRVSGAIAARP